MTTFVQFTDIVRFDLVPPYKNEAFLYEYYVEKGLFTPQMGRLISSSHSTVFFEDLIVKNNVE